VHLNPVRAGLVPLDQPLSGFAWSSYPLYLAPARRPAWLRVDRLLGEHGIQKDSAAGRVEFQRRMEQRRREGEAPEMLAALRRGWRLGASDFLQRLTEKLGREGRSHERASERRETDTERAERLVKKGLATLGWTEEDLANQPKAHLEKVRLARVLRTQTPMTLDWIAQRLAIGSGSYVAHLLRK
jgi:hypothetical protein